MLITPFDLIAKAEGFKALQYAADVYGHYQGLVGATRKSWARDNKAKLDGYIRGYVTALDWLYRPENKDEAIAILRKNLPQMSPELAAQTHAVLAGPKGFTLKARLDVDGVKRVLELRKLQIYKHTRLIEDDGSGDSVGEIVTYLKQIQAI
jgi:ABC-type nitrate/sulfonate/bicarbonate transport system substrate-binding protein